MTRHVWIVTGNNRITSTNSTLGIQVGALDKHHREDKTCASTSWAERTTLGEIRRSFRSMKSSLNLKLQSVCDKNRTATRACYVRERGYRDNVQESRCHTGDTQVTEIANQERRPLHFDFLDISKADDSVEDKLL